MKLNLAMGRRSQDARSPLVFACAFGLLASVASAQVPDLFVSTSSTVAIHGFDDGDVLSVGVGQTPTRHFGAGHFRALYGGVPGDVDALTYQPVPNVGGAGTWAFSLLSNEAGFLDGDVLGFAPGGGLMVMVSESELALALGITGTTLDVDAATFDSTGRLVFSLQANHGGTTIGDVSDGDVLRQELDGTVTRMFTEDDVNLLVGMAGVSGSIADVQALHIAGDELWVCVQSPSSADGAVIAIDPLPRVVATEDELGLDGAELNALMVAENAPAVGFDLDTSEAAAGATVSASFRGMPGDTLLILWSGAVGTFDFAHAAGFGRWYLDVNDPWLAMAVAKAPLIGLDGAGHATIDYTLPAGVAGVGLGGEMGWSFQALSLGGFELSAPFRIAAN